MTDGCRVECLAPEAAARHLSAWTALEARCLESSVFNAPGFALAAARFIPGPRPRVLLVWDGEALIGLCLLAPPLLGWPVRAWLHPQAVAAMPLLDKAAAARALAAMLAWAVRRLQPGLILHGVPEAGATAALLATGPWRTATIATRLRAVLPAGRAPDGLTGKAAKEIRRQARRLAEKGVLTYRVSTTPAAIAADLDRFLALEAAGWKGRRGTALGHSPGLAAFVRAMAASLAEERCCHVHSLDLDGRPAAMGLVLRSGPTAYFWKTAFDEALARFSPGVHLTEAIGLAQAHATDLSLTDSCAAPDHPMIDRLWPDRMAVADTLVCPGGVGLTYGQAVLALERARRRGRATLVALLRRSGLHPRR